MEIGTSPEPNIAAIKRSLEKVNTIANNIAKSSTQSSDINNKLPEDLTRLKIEQYAIDANAKTIKVFSENQATIIDVFS